MANNNREKEDLALLNMCWCYKQKIITREQFINAIDNFKHSFEELLEEKEKIEVKVGRPIKITDEQVIIKIMKLHKSGISTRKISNILKEENEIDLHFNAVLSLINRIKNKFKKEEPEKKKEVVATKDKYLELIDEMSELDFQSSGDTIDKDDIPNGMGGEEDE